jgi:membrane fusion protein
MRKSLFRAELQQASSNSWYGQVLLLQPLSLRLLTACVIACRVGIIVFLSQAQYTKRINASGTLAPDLGLIKVQSPHTGVVLARRVSEGQMVRAGDVLYVISTEVVYAPGNDSGQRTGMASAMLEKLAARRALIRDDSANTAAMAERERTQERAKIASLDEEVAQLDQEIAIQQERLASKQVLYDRNAQAQAQGFLSPLALQQKYDDLLDQKARVQSMRRSRLGLARTLAEARANFDALGRKDALAKTGFERQLLDVDQQRVTQEAGGQILVTAPQAGQVAAVLAEPGQRVDSQTLLTILPAGSALEVQVFVPSAAIGAIRVGDPAQLRFLAFPYQQYGAMEGKVGEISSTTLSALEQSGAADKADAGRYRIRVRMPLQYLVAAGRQHQLRSGMQLDVQFAQQRRTLLEWILEPLVMLKEKA